MYLTLTQTHLILFNGAGE
jgi:hypothetical protein